MFTINKEERLTCEMSLEISVFSAILRHHCPHCCSSGLLPFSPFPPVKSNALCPVFPHRYVHYKLWLVHKRSLPGGLSKMQWQHYMGVGPGAKNKMGPLPQSGDICMVSVPGGFSPGKLLNLGSLKWHFLHFERNFE